MDERLGGWSDADRAETKIDAVLAAGAVGGLIGLMFGPVGTLTCVLIGAGLGYARVLSRPVPAGKRANPRH